MLLTNNEMQLVRQAVEIQSGLDHELITRCSPLVHIAAFDDAVRQAFVVLEERLRRLLKKERATGIQMVNYAFSTDGPFTKMLADSPIEREGFQDLLSGAFKLYRNPTAHTIVGYEGAEARSIISYIDLILKRLDRLSSILSAGNLPDNVEQLIKLIEKTTDVKVAQRIKVFAGRCVQEGLVVSSDAKQWIPFRKHALVGNTGMDNPKSHPVTVFYLYGYEKKQSIWFPINQYYTKVIGLDVDPIKKELRQLGFLTKGAAQEYQMPISIQTEQEFIDHVFTVIQKIAKQFDATLT